MHGIVWEELSVFLGQLRSQSLVMCQDKRGLIEVRDDVRRREGLAAARHPEQGLVTHAFIQPFIQGPYRLGLVACRLEWVMQLEITHICMV
jgi:hypothetical protein